MDCYPYVMEGNTLIQERQQLRELLAGYRDESKELPYLTAELEANWLEKAWEAGREWLAAWWEQLREAAGPLPTFGLWQVDWRWVAQVVFWGGAILLMGWVVWWIVKKGLALSLLPGERMPIPNPMLNAEAQLSTRILTAIEDENWSLAARLRWRLFLFRIEAQPHLTPKELFDQTDYRHFWETHQGVAIREQYRMMFSGATGSQRWYEQYHDGLAGLEGSVRHE